MHCRLTPFCMNLTIGSSKIKGNSGYCRLDPVVYVYGINRMDSLRTIILTYKCGSAVSEFHSSHLYHTKPNNIVKYVYWTHSVYPLQYKPLVVNVDLPPFCMNWTLMIVTVDLLNCVHTLTVRSKWVLLLIDPVLHIILTIHDSDC